MMMDGATIDACAIQHNSSARAPMRANEFPIGDDRSVPTILRIWQPANETPATNETTSAAAGGDNGLHPTMSLSAFFSAYVEPQLFKDDSRARNINQYRETVGLWKTYTGDPAIECIDDETCSIFMRGLRSRSGVKRKQIAETTVHKHRTHIQRVLDLAGPKTRANYKAATHRGLYGMYEEGWSRESPVLPRAKREFDLPTAWELDEIALWILSASDWTLPTKKALRGLEPGAFWPAFI